MDHDAIIQVLQKYTPLEYYELNDYDKVVERVVEVEENVFQYTLAYMVLYFDENMTPLTYGKQHVMDNMVFYDFNEDSSNGAGTYTYLGEV